MSSIDSYKSETLGFLTASLPYTSGVFYSVDSTYNAVEHYVHFAGSSSIREHDASARYEAYFHRLDPFHPRRFVDSAVSVVTLQDVIEMRSYASSEYYREFLGPLGGLYEAELFLRERGAIIGGISLLRSAERSDFSGPELTFLRTIRPLIECGFNGCRHVREEAEDLHYPEMLSAREREIVALVCAGASNAEIGRELHISLATVKTHLSNAFRKTGVRSRTQMVARMRSFHTYGRLR
jgi:DNA-binding CsgD family transcriptional regulator